MDGVEDDSATCGALDSCACGSLNTNGNSPACIQALFCYFHQKKGSEIFLYLCNIEEMHCLRDGM